jgi:predicted nuclease with TOPRIM domain
MENRILTALENLGNGQRGLFEKVLSLERTVECVHTLVTPLEVQLGNLGKQLRRLEEQLEIFGERTATLEAEVCLLEPRFERLFAGHGDLYQRLAALHQEAIGSFDAVLNTLDALRDPPGMEDPDG